MSSREFLEWQAYEALTGPLGEERADIRSAIVAMTVANAHRSRKQRPFKIRDFIPEFKPIRLEPPSVKELKMKAKQALLAAKRNLEKKSKPKPPKRKRSPRKLR